MQRGWVAGCPPALQETLTRSCSGCGCASSCGKLYERERLPAPPQVPPASHNVSCPYCQQPQAMQQHVALMSLPTQACAASQVQRRASALPSRTRHGLTTGRMHQAAPLPMQLDHHPYRPTSAAASSDSACSKSATRSGSTSASEAARKRRCSCRPHPISPTTAAPHQYAQCHIAVGADGQQTCWRPVCVWSPGGACLVCELLVGPQLCEYQPFSAAEAAWSVERAMPCAP